MRRVKQSSHSGAGTTHGPETATRGRSWHTGGTQEERPSGATCHSVTLTTVGGGDTTNPLLCRWPAQVEVT